ncbi:Cobyrinic acid A,C-diamide synthase [Striga asiatica]|uniref:Cobyrinic acid A,C-diamide synthase n=1 Tax=Striga asiatica TaxID=4170 RepID=A0A5A7R3M5_STRAF|nr:Cobyrinic acid A,C-diamide synthase [Striga asiatica]
MEAAISGGQTAGQSPATPIFKPSTKGVFSPVHSFTLPVLKSLHKGRVLKVECAKGVWLPADKKLAANEELDLEEEIIGLKELSSKCRGECGGMVELLECLEREAIMGEDEGKEPHDYNRRAQIFDKSSRIFLALKQDKINSAV